MGFGNLFGNAASPYDDVEKRAIFTPKRRSRINVLGICVNILCPCVLYTFLSWVMIFKVHYLYPGLAWSLVLAAVGLIVLTAVIAHVRKERDSDPSWYTYSSGAFFLATLGAVIYGNFLFWKYSQIYFDYQTLNTYTGVNPAIDSGRLVQDGGRFYFTDGAQLAMRKSMGFKHGDMYCVVPIATENGKAALPNYDFWAVGVNCCQDPGTFRCGDDWNNPRARSGVRLLDEDQSPFFQLAVQQAEAAYGITARHPVFFTWKQDPLLEVNNYLADAVRYFIIGIATHFIFNFCCVLFSVFAFGKSLSND